MGRIASVLLATLTSGCLGMPDGVTPIRNFDVDRYLGKWYEIARLDHSFERGLERVTAEYAPREGGGISVRNRGYSVAEGEWKEANGKAFFVDDPNTGYLKVSFFGPFYGSYVIFELDEQDYQYAFISGPDRSYLWFLSRTPQVAPELIERFVREAKERGFPTDDLIFVNQEQ